MFNEQFEMLGSLLIKNDLITEVQLNQALEQQKTVRKKIGELLLEMEALSESDLMRILSEQINIPLANKKMFENLDTSLIQLIPEPFAREHCVVPLHRSNDSVEVACTDPENVTILDNLTNLVGTSVVPFLAGQKTITAIIDRAYEALRTTGEVDTVMTDLEYEIDAESTSEDVDLSAVGGDGNDAPIVKLVNLILSGAIRDRATDIHIEPGNNRLCIRNRIDGALVEAFQAPIKSHSGVVARIKVMSKLNIAETRLPQDGRFSVKFSDRAVDVRVSILPSVLGEKIVLRLLDKGFFNLDLTSLGFSNDDLQIFRKYINRPYGIIIISGPTGSGKSTTLYSALNEIRSVEDNIVTVEDPVEYQLEGITQVAVNEKINLTFASALRSILRQDPDKVLIGEIRDQETADIAMKVALTGHLVFTTLHANDTASTMTRLVDIGVPPYLAGSSVILIISQRLIRVVCEECKEEYTPTEQERFLLDLNESDPNQAFYHGRGCERCKYTGYYGRSAIFEIMPVNSAIRKLIFDSADQESIYRKALEQGMCTLRQSAMAKLFNGKTTIREVLKHTVEEI